MKIIKKIAAIMLSVMMVLGMCSVVGAEGTTTSGTSATNDGKITIRNAVPEQTYTIYQILELESFSDKTATEPNSGNYAYKATSKWESFVKSDTGKKYLKTDGSGYVTWVEKADPAAFAKEALDYAKTSIKAEESKSAPKAEDGKTTSTLTFDNLSLGYYLVDSSVGALCSLNTTAKEVEIQEKNGVPSVEKKVKSGSTYEDKNTASIDDKVEFKTTITAKKGAENYVLHDTMSAGLTFDNKVDVTLKKNNGGSETIVSDTQYELVTPGTEIEGPQCTFEVKFEKALCDTLENDDQLIVTYSATLNEKAEIGDTGNKNETKLTYGDNNKTETATTTTRTFEIPVFKYTGTDTPLPGAIFKLSTDEKGNDIIKLEKKKGTTTEEYLVNSSGTVTKITTGDTGKFTIQGLDAGTYYLTETQQPAGYNKLKDPIKIKIDEVGVIKVVTDKEDEVTEVKVLNKSGSILPSTGGMGTTLFYIFGAILVIGSGVVLITKKRMK